MIIRRHDDSLLFMTQPDHARLAADLLAHWSADDFAAHPRREALLLAAREHDNGWREVDDVRCSLSRRARRSTSSPSATTSSSPCGLGRSIGWRRLGVCGCARRASCDLRLRCATRNPAWSAFFGETTARRDHELARTGHSQEELLHDYRFLGVADLLSLSFCNGWTDERERLGCRVRYADGAINVTPALFAEPVPVRIRVRRLPDRRYASAADLRAAFDETPPEILEGHAHGAHRS